MESSAVIALASVAVGALLTMATSVISEMIRRGSQLREKSLIFSQDEQKRHDERRWQIYAEVLGLANTVYSKVRESSTSTDPSRVSELQREIEVTREHLVSRISPAFLVSGSPEVRGALAKVLGTSRAVADAALQNPALSKIELDEALAVHRVSVRGAESVIREYLGYVE